MYNYIIKIKKHLKNYDFIYPIVQKIYHIIIFVLKASGVKFRYYVIVPEKKIIYLTNYKVASSSILSSLIDKEVSNQDEIHFEARQILKEKLFLNKTEKEYYKFTFVRNPFVRLLSCYNDKVVKERNKERPYFKQNLFGKLADAESFSHFVRQVSKIPDRVSDVHFISQSYFIYSEDKPVVDFIGKMEDLGTDYKSISEKFDLKPLPHHNKSSNSDWMDSYDINTADIVYGRYYDDLVKFGYMDEYYKLIKYLRNKRM